MSPHLSTLPATLAVLPEFPSLREVLGYQATGLLVVFIALGLIWGLMEISGAFFRRHAHASARLITPPPALAPTQAPVATAPDPTPDPATLAVIFAAVHTVLGGAAHRIVAVTPAAEPPLDWSREGRRDHFSSHRVR